MGVGMIRAFVLSVVCVALLSSCARDPEVYTVAAPNGELAFHISSDELGRVHYSVSDPGHTRHQRQPSRICLRKRGELQRCTVGRTG